MTIIIHISTYYTYYLDIQHLMCFYIGLCIVVHFENRDSYGKNTLIF